MNGSHTHPSIDIAIDMDRPTRCWIPKEARWARFGSVYVYVYPSMLFISYVFIQIYRRVVVTPNKGCSSAPVLQAAARLRVGRKLMLYLLCFLATWTFPMSE